MPPKPVSNEGKVKRRPWFTAGEVEKLKSEVEKRKAIINAPFSPTITQAVKNAQWVQVALEINKVGPHKRTYDEAKRKWENLKSGIKGKLADQYRKVHFTGTGGGSPSGHDPTPEDSRMLAIIGETAVFGITGGFDSSEQPGPSRHVVRELEPIGTPDVHSDMEEMPDIDIINSSELPINYLRDQQPTQPKIVPPKRGEFADFRRTTKPSKSTGERVLHAQEDMCSLLKRTNELLEESNMAQQSGFDRIASNLEELVKIQREKLELKKMRLDWEMEHK